MHWHTGGTYDISEAFRNNGGNVQQPGMTQCRLSDRKDLEGRGQAETLYGLSSVNRQLQNTETNDPGKRAGTQLVKRKMEWSNFEGGMNKIDLWRWDN